MPPRKRKFVKTVEQDEFPRKTRSCTRQMLSTIPQLPVTTNATISIMESKNESINGETSKTLGLNDNMPNSSKKANKSLPEMLNEEMPLGKEEVSSSESDWEEVEDLACIEDNNDDKYPSIPKEGIEITIELPEAHKKRRAKKEFDLATYVRRRIFRFRKEVQENMHKVHLLCLLGYGIRVNCITKEDTVLGIALSLIPDEFRPLKKNKQSAQKLVEPLMDWYRKNFNLCLEEKNQNTSTDFGISQILRSFENGNTTSKLVFVTMFLACIRTVGFDARLIISLQPVPFKLPKDVSIATKKKLSTQEKDATENVVNNEKKSMKKNLESCIVQEKKPRRKNPASKTKNTSKPKTTKAFLGNDEDSSRRNSRRLSHLKVSYNEDSESDHQDHAKEHNEPSKYVQHLHHKTVTELESKNPKQDIAKSVKKCVIDSDEDFKPDLPERQGSHGLKGFRKNRLALSSDEEDGLKKNDGESNRNTVMHSTDQWIELYDESAQRWICVDCIHGTIGKVKDQEANATKPISYVLSFDGKGFVKDVTQRYASSWLSHTQKLRVDASWWLETLKPYKGPRSKRDKLEDEQLEDNLLERPLPTAISEFKNHPLYALKRHLLKFEGIYPSEAVPVGFIRGEPIYSRECVKELHSRETWLKEARLVQIGETAYKVVKARPKYIRMTGEFKTDIPLELFGEWQTAMYVPPIAENGKVPRNEYGNVELFKQSMLPKGTVHLQIPGLNRVARKLGIDCAPAMIGWDFHAGGSHPTFDGWVVCKEFKATLLEAWDEEQVHIEQREKEKREKRVYGNWRRLIRGLLIKEKIRIRYAIDVPMKDEPQTGTSKETSGGSRKPRKRKKTDTCM